MTRAGISARVGLSAALATVALLMVVLVLVPGEVWHHPTYDAAYSGFDPNLMYASGGAAGSVEVRRDTVDMTSGRDSLATLNLLTTPLDRVSGAIDVSVLDNVGAKTPFRVGFWSPRLGAGYFVEFGQAPSDYVTVEEISDGATGTTLVGGNVSNSKFVATYGVGKPYRVAFDLDKRAGVLTYRIMDLGAGTSEAVSVAAHTFPKLFQSVRLAFTASAEGAAGSAEVRLGGWRLALPHERFWAVKIDDGRVTAAVIGLAIAGTLLALAMLVSVGRRQARDGSRPRFRRPSARFLAVAAAAITTYLTGNALLFQLGGHPFDMGAEKLYAYVAHDYGVDQLFYLPNLSSLAHIWRGAPYFESGFPYGPVFAYLFAEIGWLESALTAGGGPFRLGDTSLEYLIKSVNVLFGLADGFLIYAILRRVETNRRWSVVGAGLFLFNPAVWFSMSVWGETHVISCFFVLAAILMIELGLPTWAWLLLIAGCLTRPQMLVFGVVVGMVLLKKFPWRENLRALSLSTVATFVALVPLMLATGPSLSVDTLLNNFFIQGAGGNEPQVTTVSQDAYSIWPLVTYALHGASGLERAFTESSEILIGPLTYQRAGQLLAGGALLSIVIAIALRRREGLEDGGYIPLVALAITSFVMLLTGVVVTHFVLALPLLLLCRRWVGNVAYLYIAVAWTITTLVPMFGDMGLLLTVNDYPLLAGSRNAITRFFVDLYSWDRFITVAVVANICAMVWLAVSTGVRLMRPTGLARSDRVGVV